MTRIAEIQKCDTSAVNNYNTKPQNGDVEVFSNEIKTEQPFKKSLDKQYDELIQKGTKIVENCKPTFWTKLIGFNDQARTELLKLIKDPKVNDNLKELLKSDSSQDITELMKDKDRQEKIIEMLQKYTKDNNYPKINKLLNKGLVTYEMKKFMSDMK